jgi:DNA repair protein RecO (recombination protein O)
MSTIIKTEAIVLRSINFRETSKIVTFYTRQMGKIAGMVKGARRAKNRYGASLEPMSYVAMVLYKKEGRDIQTVSHCDLMKSFRHLYEDIDKMAVGMSIVELVNIVSHERQENIPLFTLLLHSLTALNDATKNPANVLYYFELHCARFLGFQPSFDHCISCEKPLKEVSQKREYKFDIEHGGLVCSSCSDARRQLYCLSPAVLQFFRTISASNYNVDQVQEYELQKNEKVAIVNFLWQYLQFHVHDLRTLKSEKVFGSILTPA